ncbi:MAG: peptide-methionine (S)-S-oxide reductase MsrA [Thermoplasmatales archaeon]|nr:MAG: peptide-methionine (S)-S-oxide reductase MsrA [Thermoplasmatales archaeon]
MIEIATFGAGCFWGVEASFEKIKGVTKTTVGYMGGNFKNPTYEDVCTDKTGHAEVTQVEFDNIIVSYDELLDVFWNIHDPTQKNRQGVDIGSQYRSVIFYHNKNQKNTAEKSKTRLTELKKYKKPIVTEITEAKEFYKAEEYHQDYLKKNKGASCKL